MMSLLHPPTPSPPPVYFNWVMLITCTVIYISLDNLTYSRIQKMEAIWFSAQRLVYRSKHLSRYVGENLEMVFKPFADAS